MRRSMLLSRTLGGFALAGLMALPAAAIAQESDPTLDATEDASAQSDDSDATADLPEDDVIAPIGIEEITVTARKREESLQETPVSMVAFGEDELEARQITNVNDIGEAVPNLKFDTGNGSSNQARIYIRGVGQDDFRSNVDPGVGLYIDGVYIPRLTGGIVSTLDVENIQVLRGPQGTLFGKNTVGGVVDLTTRKPSSEFGGRAQVRAGSFGRFETQASVDVPLIEDRVLSRFTLETQTDEGYTRNRTTDSRSGDNKLLKGRGVFRFLPTEFMTLDLSYEQTREDEKQPTPECRIGSTFAPGRVFTDNLATGFVDACAADRADGSELTAGADFDQKFDLNTQFLVGNFTWDLENVTFKSISSWRRVDTRFSNVDLDASSVDGFGVGSASSQSDTWSQEFQLVGRAFDGRLSYTTGLYGFKEKGHSRTSLSSLANTLANIRSGQDVTFQGVNLDGAIINGLPVRDVLSGLPELVSAFQQSAQDMGRALPNIPQLPSFALAQQGNQLTLAQFDALAALATILSPDLQPNDRVSATPVTDAIFGLNQTLTSRFDTTSYAAFAEGTYDLTDKLSVTGGLRYTAERKERQGKAVPVADAAQFALGELAGRVSDGSALSDRFGKWTGRVQLEYQATDSIFTYASYSRGFKSGGFNQTIDDPLISEDDDPGKFDEEVLDSYEIGLKTQWLDDRLVLNLAAFYNDYDSIQLTTIQINQDGVPEGRINNAAEATIRGLELDFVFRPFSELTFSGGIGTTETDYRDFIAREDAGTAVQRQIAAAGVDLSTCSGLGGAVCPDAGQFLTAAGIALQPGPLNDADFSDVTRSNTPNFNANVSMNYLFDLSRWGTLNATATYFLQGDVEYTTFNDDDVRQDRYGLVNGRLAWELWDGNTTIALFGRNLLDRRYISGGFSLNDTNGVKTVFFGPPRTWGVEVLRLF